MIEAVFEEFGVERYTFDHSSKHCAVTWWLNGYVKFYTWGQEPQPAQPEEHARRHPALVQANADADRQPDRTNEGNMSQRSKTHADDKACSWARVERYKGVMKPRCNGGDGCVRCWEKYSAASTVMMRQKRKERRIMLNSEAEDWPVEISYNHERRKPCWTVRWAGGHVGKVYSLDELRGLVGETNLTAYLRSNPNGEA